MQTAVKFQCFYSLWRALAGYPEIGFSFIVNVIGLSNPLCFERYSLGHSLYEKAFFKYPANSS